MKQTFRPGGIREMTSIALPMVISFACDTVMIFTDRLLLSRLGPDQMNAALAGGVSYYMMLTFMLGLTGYTTALAGQYLGAGRKENCPKVAVQAILLSLLAWPIILLARPFVEQVFLALPLGHNQALAQTIYFDALCWGAGLALIRHSLSSYFSGIGKTRIVMTASIVAMLANGIASYILIFGKLGFPALGIAGAAYGSILASFGAVMILAVGYFSNNNRMEFQVFRAFSVDVQIMGKLLRYGYPSGVEMFLSIIAFNGLVMTFHALGPVKATAASIFLNWDMVTYVPLLGIEIGVTSLVGRYMGAGRADIAHRAAMSGLFAGMVFAGFMFILFVFFPEPLAFVFRPEGDQAIFHAALPEAVYMLRLVSVYLISIVLLIVFTGALRGAGDTLWAMVFSISLHWFLTAALFVMLHVFYWPVRLSWTVVVCLFLAFSTLVLFRYRQGRWKHIRIVNPQ